MRGEAVWWEIDGVRIESKEHSSVYRLYFAYENLEFQTWFHWDETFNLPEWHYVFLSSCCSQLYRGRGKYGTGPLECKACYRPWVHDVRVAWNSRSLEGRVMDEYEFQTYVEDCMRTDSRYTDLDVLSMSLESFPLWSTMRNVEAMLVKAGLGRTFNAAPQESERQAIIACLTARLEEGRSDWVRPDERKEKVF